MMRKFNDMPNFSGKLIRAYRLENRLSCEKLAQKLQLMGFNVDRTYIHKVEANKVHLKDFELIAFGKILGIDYKKLETLYDGKYTISVKKDKD